MTIVSEQPLRRGDGRGAGLAHMGGGALAAMRAVWLTLTGGLVALVTVGFARAFAEPDLVMPPALREVFLSLGLDERVMLAVALAGPFAAVVVISVLVFVRRSDDPMALLFTLTLLALYSFVSRTLLTYAEGTVLGHAVSAVFAVLAIGLALLLGLFPDGRFAPRWTRWLPVPLLALLVAFPQAGRMLLTLVDGRLEMTAGVRALLVLCAGIFLAGVVAQAHRYRRVSGPTERQQAKWVVAPLSVLLLAAVAILVVSAALPDSSTTWVGWLLFATVPLAIVLPFMVANAVLRYRLYEIDRIVSRTIAYGLVVAALGAVYAAGVLGLGAAVSAVTGERSTDLVVAASVLAAAALVRPLHRRVQDAVDRRFHRTGYEARLVVEAYARRLRHTEDLAAMRRDLAAAAVAAVKPSHVSLWLAPAPATPARRGRAA